MPANTGYVDCTGGSSCGVAAGTVTWAVGTLAAGATATVSFVVSASTTVPVSDTPYTISNTATATSTETPTPSNSNTVTNQLDVKPTIVKSVSATEAGTGQALTYTLTVSNPGAPFTADVGDVVPAGTSFSGTGGCTPACTFDGSKVNWTGATIPAGTSTFSFGVTVTAAGGSTVTNVGFPRRHEPRPRADRQQPDRDSDRAGARIDKQNAPTGAVAAGDTITYTLVVSNASDVTATSVVLTDTVPSALDYVSCTGGDSCSQSGGVVTWTFASVGAASQTVELHGDREEPGSRGRDADRQRRPRVGRERAGRRSTATPSRTCCRGSAR